MTADMDTQEERPHHEDGEEPDHGSSSTPGYSADAEKDDQDNPGQEVSSGKSPLAESAEKPAEESAAGLVAAVVLGGYLAYKALKWLFGDKDDKGAKADEHIAQDIDRARNAMNEDSPAPPDQRRPPQPPAEPTSRRDVSPPYTPRYYEYRSTS